MKHPTRTPTELKLAHASAGSRGSDSRLQRTPPAARDERSGAAFVYAVASGLAERIPVPWAGALLAESVRRAAMRRVARRHGVHLADDACRVLARTAPDFRTWSRREPVRVFVRKMFSRLARIEQLHEAFGVLVATLLFDRYLRHRPRAASTTLERSEAERVRTAIDLAIAGSYDRALLTIPAEARATLTVVVESLLHDDRDGRSRPEAALHALIDRIAEAPEEILDGFEARFESMFARLA
jgi:hypothetical protein